MGAGVRGAVVWVALAALLAPAGASAQQWVYTAHAGGGVGLQLAPAPLASPAGMVFLQSVLGVTDRLNLEVPVLIEVGGDPALTLGTALELTYFSTNHWRLVAGAGAALRTVFGSRITFGAAPFAMTAVRWLFTWGVGASLGVHVLFPIALGRPVPAGGRGSLHVYPVLALYQEFW